MPVYCLCGQSFNRMWVSTGNSAFRKHCWRIWPCLDGNALGTKVALFVMQQAMRPVPDRSEVGQ